MQLTIIIPVYNSEEYIKNVIVSLQRQTNQNFNVLFIDDGSTDNTSTILKNSFYKNPYVKIVTKENGGPSSARNLGIDLVDTEYFTFLDSDDAISANYADSILNHLSIGKTLYINAAYIKKDLEKYLQEPLYSIKSSSETISKKLIPLDLNRIVFNTGFVKTGNLKLNPISHYEGELFCIDYVNLINCKEVELLKDCYHLHYQRPGSLTRSSQIDQVKRFSNSLPVLESYIGKYSKDIDIIILGFIENTKRWIKEA